MDSKLESRYQMYLTTEGFVKTATAITSKLPSFDGYFTEFTKNNALIRSTKEQLEHLGYGIASNKGILRKRLIDLTLETSAVVEVYAKIIGNVVLAKEIHYSESNLKKSRGTTLTDKALMVIQRTTEHAKELEPFGITTATIADLKSAIDSYNEVIPSIRINQTVKKVDFSTLRGLFKTNENLLEKMDLLVELTKKSNHDFYFAYKSNRKVIIMGTGPLSVIGKVVCASDATAIKGAKATFAQKVSAEASAKAAEAIKPIVKRTAAKGGFHVKKVPEGIYTLTVEKVGYATQTVTVSISSSDITKLEVKLEKN